MQVLLSMNAKRSNGSYDSWKWNRQPWCPVVCSDIDDQNWILVSIKHSWKSSQAKLVRACRRLNADASLVRIEQCRVVGDADVMTGTIEPVKAGEMPRQGSVLARRH